MRNFFTFLFILLLANLSVNAQSRIEGSIQTQNGELPIRIVVKMEHLADAKLSKELYLSGADYFILEELTDGCYQLEVSANEYKTITIPNFRFPQDTDQVLGLTMEKIMTDDIRERPLGNDLCSDGKKILAAY